MSTAEKTTTTTSDHAQTELRDDELAIVSGGKTAGGTVAAGWDIKANKRV